MPELANSAHDREQCRRSEVAKSPSKTKLSLRTARTAGFVAALAVGAFVLGAGCGSENVAPVTDAQTELTPGGLTGQGVQVGNLELTLPSGWRSWMIYGGPSSDDQGLQMVSTASPPPAGEDEIKAMDGDNVAVTLIPRGSNPTPTPDVKITRDVLDTTGPTVPRDRAQTELTICRAEKCFLVAVLFSTAHPSQNLIEQVNEMLNTVRPSES